MTTNDQTKMKKKRRTLKNRGYAETTRRKKEDEIKKLWLVCRLCATLFAAEGFQGLLELLPDCLIREV